MTDCTHHLVPDGSPCPQCLWDAAASGPASERQSQLALIAEMVDACRRVVGSEPGWAEAAAKGPWYALKLVRQVCALKEAS